MQTDMIYMPTFRVRQQEIAALRAFSFGTTMYPMLEIIKEHDRVRSESSQKTFSEIYTEIIDSINAEHIFVDIPVFLRERASMQDEVLSFSRSVASDVSRRTEYLLSLSHRADRAIPVVYSFLEKTGTSDYIAEQVEALRPAFKSLAFRILYAQFENSWEQVTQCSTENDFIILDLDTIPPYPSPALKPIIKAWQDYTTCKRIVLRSAINTDIQNILLTNNEVMFSADNSILENFRSSFKADAFGDYAGVKKDDLTAGGTISPGMLFYNAASNEFVGFRGHVKSLSEFETTIVPAIIASTAVSEMQASGLPYLDENRNNGWKTILNIANGNESGKSQAKFKRIAIDHYLHCINVKIEMGIIS